MRAGLGGQTSWVPRIDRDRQVICDRPPTFSPPPVAPAVAEAPAAGEDEPPAVDAVAAAPAAAPRRVAVAAPPAARQAPAPQVAVARGAGRKIGCYASAPVPLRVRLTTGGTAVLCTRGDGTLEGAHVPFYPEGAADTASLGAPGQAVNAVRVSAGASGAEDAAVSRAATRAEADSLPPGYRAAWQDGRLNPQRGPRTVAGDAQQDQVWTRDVPARAAAPVAAGQSSTRGEAPGDRHYVQVGAFAVPGNAVRARETLRAIGLPTARAETAGLTMVFAGPFATEDEARIAQGAARGAGYGDAFIR
jgi:hypothetical protein